VAIHWLLAVLAFRWRWLGPLVKGGSHVLVREGEVQWDAMRANAITRLDLEEALRNRGHPPRPDDVREARLERSGDISIVKRSREQQIEQQRHDEPPPPLP
jgi:uncharacterized membrane protein YcaP (DUF421 family)